MENGGFKHTVLLAWQLCLVNIIQPVDPVKVERSCILNAPLHHCDRPTRSAFACGLLQLCVMEAERGQRWEIAMRRLITQRALACLFIEEIGGPGRDRTDDRFHAMERRKSQLADGKGFNSRTSRQNR